MNIYFKNITEENLKECIDLKISKEQEKYLPHTNVASIAESKFYPQWVTLGIYKDDKMIGFAMYGVDDEEADCICLIRFMIDEQYQGKGYGKRALEFLLNRIKEESKPSKIYLSFHPDSIVAKKLYLSFGFTQFITGFESEDEVFYEINYKYMCKKRKVILYIAQSIDGYIAREDNDISWLSIVERPNEDYGYENFIKTVDTVIMGRITYEKVLSFGIEFPYKGMKCYVLSKTLKGNDQNVEFYNGNINDLIKRLKCEEGKNIFIDGGAEVVKEFRSENLIDEYVISILPVLLGKGIRLFKETDNENQVKLVESKTFDSGLVQLKYERVE
ncbi:hypothetical protein GCM10008905_29370 [Clostridium malenominatum]|uniref:N-acetyltransferase domain-containing protein n=1 Tax=Clostridium malenominatum TaxID=1539 RepID=A0ABP3UBN4_9CLOT